MYVAPLQKSKEFRRSLGIDGMGHHQYLKYMFEDMFVDQKSTFINTKIDDFMKCVCDFTKVISDKLLAKHSNRIRLKVPTIGEDKLVVELLKYTNKNFKGSLFSRLLSRLQSIGFNSTQALLLVDYTVFIINNLCYANINYLRKLVKEQTLVNTAYSTIVTLTFNRSVSTFRMSTNVILKYKEEKKNEGILS